MSMAISGIRHSVRLAGAIMAVAALGACSEGGNLGFLQPKDSDGAAKEVQSSTQSKPTKLVERDVEAPDVFSTEEAGLWDGRPSLGGVWIAHPDVKDPERVTIRNAANGKEVIGALFRRERDIPGPRLQASSDAAVARGMIAGAPVRLDVVALRREEIKPDPVFAQTESAPGLPASAEAVDTVPEAAQVAEAKLDPIAGAAAAIDASAAPQTDQAEEIAETKPKRKGFSLFKRREKPVDVPETLAQTDSAATTVTEAANETAQAEPEQKRKRFSLFKRRDESTQEAALLAAPETDASGTPAPDQSTRRNDAQADAIAAAVAEAGATPDATPKPRDRLFGGLFARKKAPEDVGAPLSALAPDDVRVASIDATPLPKAAPKPQTRKSSLAKPYLQIGIFSVEENANNTARQMRSNGVVPTVFEQTSGGKTFWRVVVGPARTGTERASLLKKIKGIGFSDAYAVTN